MKPVIYLDLDGVLANFNEFAKEAFGENWKEELEKPGWGRFTRIPDLYRLLEPMPYAAELYEQCCKKVGRSNVHILTALPRRASFPLAAKHKTEWARLHIHIDIRVHFGPYAHDKCLHVRHSQDVLIDDNETNIQEWKEVGGTGILHTDVQETLRLIEAV